MTTISMHMYPCQFYQWLSSTEYTVLVQVSPQVSVSRTTDFVLPHDPYVKLKKTAISYLFDENHNKNSVDEVFLSTLNVVEKVLQEIQIVDWKFDNIDMNNERVTAIDLWKNFCK